MRRLLLGLAFVTTLVAGTIVPELERVLQTSLSTDKIPVIIQTRKQGDLTALPSTCIYDEKVAYLQDVAREAQQDILVRLTVAGAEDVRSFWLVSRIALRATPAIVRELAVRGDVGLICEDCQLKRFDPEPTGTPKGGGLDVLWNIRMVRADESWADGYLGDGIVVGDINTGVQCDHPAFGSPSRWRSVNGWYDAVNHVSPPYDDHGTGTAEMGIMCGGPEARIQIMTSASHPEQLSWPRKAGSTSGGALGRATLGWTSASTGWPVRAGRTFCSAGGISLMTPRRSTSGTQ